MKSFLLDRPVPIADFQQPLRHIALLLLVAFSLLVAAVLMQIAGSNQALFIELNALSHELPRTLLPAYVVDALWSNLTLMADTLFAVAIILFIGSRAPHLLTQGLVLLIIGGLFVQGGKFYFDLARPPAVLDSEQLTIVGPKLTKHSFPSGHSFTVWALATLLICQIRSLFPAVLILIVASFSAFSRIAVAAHWPLDVLVGSGCGVLVAMTCLKLSLYFKVFHHPYWQHVAFGLMFAATISFFSYDSRYPATELTGQVISVITLLVSSLWYLAPRINRKFG